MRADFTLYRTSDPAKAAVGQDGLLTAQTYGVVFVTATNDGATAVQRLDIASASFDATIAGVMQLPGGSTAVGVEVTTLPFGGSAFTDAVGAFELSLSVPAGAGAVTVRATLQDGGRVSRAL